MYFDMFIYILLCIYVFKKNTHICIIVAVLFPTMIIVAISMFGKNKIK